MHNLNEIAFQLIAQAGDAKSLAFEALAEIKNKNYIKGSELLEKSEELLTNAHKIQFEMIQAEVNNELDGQLTILVAHSQDHLMTTISTIDLIKEIIVLYKLVID